MDRATKLRKLNDWRRSLPHCSASALSAILKSIRDDAPPEGVLERYNFRDARNNQMRDPTPFGPTLQSISLVGKDNSVKHMAVAHPLANLWKAVCDCKPFRLYLKSMLEQSPSSPDKPWTVLLYSDEVTPGNPLATLNKRKFHAVYWSFLELGINALSREESWFCIAAEYSTKVNLVSAGLSQVFAALIKLFFDSDGISTAGVLLDFGDECVRIWAVLGGVIQDGGAHKSVWHSRGDAGSKYCLLCKNIFTEESKLCDEDGTKMLSCNVIKHRDLVPATSRDMRATARYIEAQAGALGPEPFRELQQALGMTYHPHSLLLNRSLDDIVDPVNVYMHDPMHALFVDGVCNIVVYLLLESFIAAGHPGIYDAFSNYCANWRWPGRVNSKHLPEIFAETRKDNHRKAHHIKCQSSDMLSLLPVLAIFTMHVLMKLGCKAQCVAFLALVDVVDIILATSRISVAATRLLDAVEKFLQLFVDVWGFEWMTPKFHWLLHLPSVLRRFMKLLSCFCLERKHRVAKRYATELANTSSRTASSLLQEVVSHHFVQLNHPDSFSFGVGLVGAKAPSTAMKKVFAELGLGDQHVMWSRESRFSPLATCMKDDMVIFNSADGIKAGKVQLHCEVEGVATSLVSFLSLVKKEAGSGYAVWANSGVTQLIETTSIVDTVVYSNLANNSVGIILPLEFR